MAEDIGVRIGSGANMMRIHERLKTAGVLIPYVSLYPGVGPEGLLRIAVCAAHTTVKIDTRLTALAKTL